MRFPLIPYPQLVQAKGVFTPIPDVQHSYDPVSFPHLQNWVDYNKLPVAISEIEIASRHKEVPAVRDDYSYRLKFNDKSVSIHAVTEWGAINAVSTLQQLILSGSVPVNGEIVDQPQYPWRGLMIDVARHYIDFELLLQTIDLMAYFRLNVLHLHLTDDQGFRFESKRFPKLATEPYYTQAQLRQLVEYAADRGVRVVPELDVPGHVTSWLQGYPEWGARTHVEPSTGYGVHDACLDPIDPQVMSNLLILFEELTYVFRDEYIHIGGDEVNGKWWQESETVRTYMATNSLQNTTDVQARFANTLIEGITKLGKKVIGWDEMLHPMLSDSVTIQAWRGMRAQTEAMQAGHACVVSSPYYLDLHYPADMHFRYDPSMNRDAWEVINEEILRDTRLKHVREGVSFGLEFGVFPELPDRPGGEIMGGEACMWSELVDSNVLIKRVWSRLPVISERFWNGPNSASVSDSYASADIQLPEALRFYGIAWDGTEHRKYTSMQSFQPLFEQLEPIKWYSRLLGPERVAARAENQPEDHIPRPYDLHSKFDRVIDMVSPDSLAARKIARDIDSDIDFSDIQSAWKHLPKELSKHKSAFEEREYADLLRCAGNLAELAEIWQATSPPNPVLERSVGEFVLPVARTINQKGLREVTRLWDEPGESFEPIEIGHINDTYQIEERLVLQQINTNVFPDPEVLGRNYQAIRPHVAEQIVEILPNRDRTYISKASGGYWRLSMYEKSRTFNELNLDLCESAGAAFGSFLAGFRGKTISIEEALPGFHDLRGYLHEFDAMNKSEDAQEACEFVKAARRRFQPIEGEKQVIHGDCKVNNLLFHPDNPVALRIIDLDTVMLEHPALDFGDFIRSLVGSEDNTDYVDKVKAGTKGFFDAFPISKDELATYAQAPAYMAFMLGLRYLIDHCTGNRYFKTKYAGENLQKCLLRFQLAKRFEAFQNRLEAILAECLR